MSIINTIIASETPRDFILFLTKRNDGISYPMLDGLYNRNNWVNISNNLKLLKLVEKMQEEGLVIHSGSGIKKGPNWKEPTFVTQNKYTFD